MICATPENNLLNAWMPKKKPLSFRPDANLEERVGKILAATAIATAATSSDSRMLIHCYRLDRTPRGLALSALGKLLEAPVRANPKS